MAGVENRKELTESKLQKQKGLGHQRIIGFGGNNERFGVSL